MIGQRTRKPTAREEKEAYLLATERDGDICQRCQRNCGPTARDHRKNRSQGGQTLASNLQILGLKCHQWKTEHVTAAILEGWGCPSWADPASWPARRWVPTDHGTVQEVWVIYDDLGGFVVISDVRADELMNT